MSRTKVSVLAVLAGICATPLQAEELSAYDCLIEPHAVAQGLQLSPHRPGRVGRKRGLLRVVAGDGAVDTDGTGLRCIVRHIVQTIAPCQVANPCGQGCEDAAE